MHVRTHRSCQTMSSRHSHPAIPNISVSLSARLLERIVELYWVDRQWYLWRVVCAKPFPSTLTHLRQRKWIHSPMLRAIFFPFSIISTPLGILVSHRNTHIRACRHIWIDKRARQNTWPSSLKWVLKTLSLSIVNKRAALLCIRCLYWKVSRMFESISEGIPLHYYPHGIGHNTLLPLPSPECSWPYSLCVTINIFKNQFTEYWCREYIYINRLPTSAWVFLLR